MRAKLPIAGGLAKQCVCFWDGIGSAREPVNLQKLAHHSGTMNENMQVDTTTALIVCTGPSLDVLSRIAWRELCQAGAIVAVNGALTARAPIENNVRFTHVVAMSIGESMEAAISGFLKKWRSTFCLAVGQGDSP
jgi:hypothetical protein